MSIEQLNQKLWQGDELIPEVKEKLLEIVDNFIEYLKEDEIDLKLKDIVIVGSNANFNYTSESDIDLHIIADMSDIEDDEEKRILVILYNAYKSLFNNKYDIQIKGHNAEVYVEPDETSVQSGAIYSLLDGWIKRPEDKVFVDDETSSSEYDKAFAEWKAYYDSITSEFEHTLEIDDAKLNMSENLSDEEKTILNNITVFLTDIYDERKKALKKDGENSIGNKIFKQFRRLGYIRLLKDKKAELEAKEMSLESLQESMPDQIKLFFNLRDGLVDKSGKFLNKTVYSKKARQVIERELQKMPNREGNLILTADNQIEYWPIPEDGYAVSGEQYEQNKLLTETQLYKFNDLVEGERIMFFYSEGTYGKEYSSYTHNEKLCIEACLGLLGDEFSKQERYGIYIKGKYRPSRIVTANTLKNFNKRNKEENK